MLTLKVKLMLMDQVHLICRRALACQQGQRELRAVRSPSAYGFREPGENVECWVKTDCVLNLNNEMRVQALNELSFL